ncbi:MAG: dNTP triphosphohydrolase [Planctomycetes bacterium]|nr:dNTP triphosphohydrolase [Planctomycetota bacterium]
MFNRADLEEREYRTLSRLGLKARDSEGRRVFEEPDPLRTCFQRDRDRILHSKAFRRLQHKTQVFAAGAGDHYRTRLPHTLEVSQLARSAATTLGLNPDVAEGVALAHDLGHPPFGHVGERALHARMSEFGGFRHNAQGLRIVDDLEESYADRNGLNLCRETRLCMLKARMPIGFPRATDLPETATPFLEGQIVDLCDRIAYVCHDFDDALHSGLVPWRTFAATELPSVALDSLVQRFPALREEGPPDRSGLIRRQITSAMISMLVRDLVLSTSSYIDEHPSLRSPHDVVDHGHVACQGESMRLALAELLRVLRQHFYRHEAVLSTMHARAADLERLFDALVSKPDMLPSRFRRRVAVHGLERTVCDYVSGMTDPYATETAKRLTDPNARR